MLVRLHFRCGAARQIRTIDTNVPTEPRLRWGSDGLKRVVVAEGFWRATEAQPAWAPEPERPWAWQFPVAQGTNQRRAAWAAARSRIRRRSTTAEARAIFDNMTRLYFAKGGPGHKDFWREKIEKRPQSMSYKANLPLTHFPAMMKLI